MATQRITKSWVKNQKFRLIEKIRLADKLDDGDLKKLLLSYWPNLVIAENDSRDKILKAVVEMMIHEVFPDYLLD